MNILNYKTFVIKIGSSLIVDGKNKIKTKWFKNLVMGFKKKKKKKN